jgi:alanine racemase
MDQTWLEISRSALLNNVSEIKKILAPQTKFMAVVKANAYGHGLFEVVNIIKNKVDALAVYDFKDAILLRDEEITKPLLVLARLWPEQIASAIKNNLEVTVTTFDVLEELKKTAPEKYGKKKLKVHICVDTGLGRDGFASDAMEKLLEILQNKNLQKNIELVGLYSHFASADNVAYDYYTTSQINVLKKWQKAFEKIGLKPSVHTAASAGTLSGLATGFDMVRIGLSLYGFWPSQDVKTRNQNKVNLRPVLEWKVKISEVKNMSEGSAISYNCTHILKRDSKVAVLPIGYFDGVPRIASNKAYVLVNGKKVPQIGRVTMNLIVLDVTDVKKVKEGDIATIIGCDDDETISAEDWASWSQTVNYEISTRLNASLLRKVVK